MKQYIQTSLCVYNLCYDKRKSGRDKERELLERRNNDQLREKLKLRENEDCLDDMLKLQKREEIERR